MRRILSGLLATTLLGCAPAIEEAGPSLPAGWEACTNPDLGYSIAHPPEWHRNDPGEIGLCRAFHPEPFELPFRAEMPLDLAVVIHVEEVPLEETLPPTLGEELISGGRTTVAGREAFRGTVRSTGEGFLPAGIVAYRYHVDLGSRTLIAGAHDVGDVPFERKRQLLDRMMETLRLDD